MGTEGTIWEMRSPGTECNCGCVIHVAGGRDSWPRSVWSLVACRGEGF